MKRLFAPLLALCGLLSCSSDNDTAPDYLGVPNGLYVSANDMQVLGVSLVNGQCAEMVLYQKDGNQYMVNGFTTSGAWPKYEYAHYAAADGVTVGQTNEAFTMSATFHDNTDWFVADYNGQITAHSLGYGQQSATFTIEGKGVKFTLTDGPIDANGDGIPDVLQ